jgi:hypothetical protein
MGTEATAQRAIRPRLSYTEPGCSIVAPCTGSANATAASIGRVQSGFLTPKLDDRRGVAALDARANICS